MLYSRPDLMHRILAGQRRRGGAVPERADRRRRAGGDDLRQLGRRAGRRRLPGIQPGLHRARAGAAQARARRRDACRASSSPRAAACGWRRWPALDCDVLGLDWTVNLGTARARGRRPGKALQGNLDPNVLFAPPEADRRRSGDACSTASARPHRRDGTGPDAHLQPGPRHQPVHPAGARGRAGGGGARPFARGCAAEPLDAGRGAALGAESPESGLFGHAAENVRCRLDLCTKLCCGAPMQFRRSARPAIKSDSDR